MQKTLTEQLAQAVRHCCTFNLKKTVDWQICSEYSFSNLQMLADEICAYISEHYPKTAHIRFIDCNIIQGFISSKLDDCKANTLRKIMSRIRKLERCCKHIYPEAEFNWGINDVIIPASTKTDGITKNISFPLVASRTIIPDALKKRSQAGKAVVLSTDLGMRVGEDVCIQVKDIHFSDGEFGFGYANIKDGDEGGAKNKKARVIPILGPEEQVALRSITARKNPDDYVIAKKDGNKMTTGNVLRVVGSLMDAECGDTYKGNRCHAMRKTWAQRYYDLVRPYYSREEGVEKQMRFWVTSPAAEKKGSRIMFRIFIDRSCAHTPNGIPSPEVIVCQR